MPGPSTLPYICRSPRLSRRLINTSHLGWSILVADSSTGSTSQIFCYWPYILLPFVNAWSNMLALFRSLPKRLLISLRQKTSRPRSGHVHSPLVTLHVPPATFSAQRALLSGQPDTKSQQSNSANSGNTSFPTLNFADLRASRAVKITVLAALGVFGTIETIFWARALWQYLSPLSPSSPTHESD